MKSKTKTSGFKIFSYDLLSSMQRQNRISKIFNAVKTGEIVVIEGRLDVNEELELTNKALMNIDSKFTGIEIAHLLKEKKMEDNFLEFVKDKVISLIAKNRLGITVIGPSKKIKEIKMDPSNLEILFK
jgi:uncharacterized protein